MTFISPLKLTLAAMVAAFAVALTASVPAGAITAPVQCGTIKVKGKKWRITADQIRCSTAKKYSATYIRTFRTPRYYKCKRGTSFWRVCTASRYSPDRIFFIRKR